MELKKIDSNKFDIEECDRLLADIEEKKREMEQSRQKKKQADGTTIRVYDYNKMVAFNKACNGYMTWFKSCLKN